MGKQSELSQKKELLAHLKRARKTFEEVTWEIEIELSIVRRDIESIRRKKAKK
jgi:hypothetical protein